ncbi:MAG: hypothetical protein AAF799_46500 [Myxococcota bacterium]
MVGGKTSKMNNCAAMVGVALLLAGGCDPEATGRTGGPGGAEEQAESCGEEFPYTFVYNGESFSLETVTATCRAEGEHVVVYVADDVDPGVVSDESIDGLIRILEEQSPSGSIDPGQGALMNNEAIFGPLDDSQFPGGKLPIFVVDTHGGGDGYLCDWCEYPQIHLDGPLLQPLDGEFSASIATHEIQHVIHGAYDEDEAMWVEESLAEAAMTANGYFTDIEWLEGFVAQPDRNWGPGEPEVHEFDYGAALLWGSFLWERGGASLMQAITFEPKDGWDGIDAALEQVGDPKGAFELYQDMIVAMYLDAPQLGYGFSSFDVPDVRVADELTLESEVSGSVSEYGIDYIDIVDPEVRTLEFASDRNDLIAGRVVVVGDEEVRVTSLEPETSVSIGAGDSAFIAITSRGAAGYTLRAR